MQTGPMKAGPQKTGPLLITSFRPWRARQPSNSSDDLIAAAASSGQLPKDTVWLRQLPVHFQLAPMQVICEIYRRRPSAVICCGMAEKRSLLSLEQRASSSERCLETLLDLPELTADTALTEISQDAGSYVCNHLYYKALEFIDQASFEVTCIFIHVPLLNRTNEKIILRDFARIVAKLPYLAPSKSPTIQHFHLPAKC